jgi:hypothetical protein
MPLPGVSVPSARAFGNRMTLEPFARGKSVVRLALASCTVAKQLLVTDWSHTK